MQLNMNVWSNIIVTRGVYGDLNGNNSVDNQSGFADLIGQFADKNGHFSEEAIEKFCDPAEVLKKPEPQNIT